MINYSRFLDSLSLPHRNLLSRLTSASSDLPPGYLYNDIVEFVKTDLAKLNEIEEYLINKLARREPYVKLKCLKLLKHLCVKFPRDFIRPKVTQSQLVAECKNYRAPHTERNSDHLSKLVRAEFEDLIRVVCSYDSSANGSSTTHEDRMVGFGNDQYQNFGQPGSCPPGYTNPNTQPAPAPYSSYPHLNAPYESKGMVGFGNPNMPPPQSSNSNSFVAFASTFTPTVSEIKNAGNNALRMISNAANRYLPTDLVEKIEKVGSAISATASEQFEKYLGNRTPARRAPQGNLNNSMYNSNARPGGYAPGFGYNSNPTQPGYASAGFGPGALGTPGYNTVGHAAPGQYARPQNFKTSPSFSNTQNFNGPPPPPSHGFGAFPSQPTSPQAGPRAPARTSPKAESVDLLSTEPEVKPSFAVPGTSTPDTAGEREAEFVKEMLTFTGIKVSPSPRLIEEYMAKMREMDTQAVVDELVKHLNVRSSRWQTHFRILCILEAMLSRGVLDERSLGELKRTATPIFNKCADEPQLSAKATKLLSMLAEGAVPLLAAVSGAFKAPETAGQPASPGGADALFPADAHDIFAAKPAAPQAKEAVSRPEAANEFDLFFTDPVVAPAHAPAAPKRDPPSDPFDFDSLSFGNPPAAKAPAPPVVSNIDNNLDLFDNTDFSAAIFESSGAAAKQPKATAEAHMFDLI